MSRDVGNNRLKSNALSGLSPSAAADDDDDDDDDDAIVMMMYDDQRAVTAAAAAECIHGDGIHGDVLAGKT